jgi:hypothetical protein
MNGTNLSAKEAGDLERIIAKNPEDLSARTTLLGYYFRRCHVSPKALERRRIHILWIIKNRPEAGIADLPYSGIRASMDQSGYDEARKLWLEQTRFYSQNATILGHAAKFFLIDDQNLAEGLLKKAQGLDPHNSEWHDRLGHLYGLQTGRKAAAKSLAAYEKAQLKEKCEMAVFDRLSKLAKSAVEAGEVQKASQYAAQLLATAAEYPNDWNYGNAIHHGNNVAGRVALKRGNISLAEECLLKAGRTPGSPQLNSFGPNMSLAKLLLQKGRNETVLQFFELCRRFWRSGGERLNSWEKEVKAGKIPQFGANLIYS